MLNIRKRTSLARRTLYSLIKTGLHGCNGLNAKFSHKIYQVYVLPRLLYGLEVLSLNKKQLDELGKFHLEILKNIQSLPTRTANAIVYLLLGALPLKAEIEKKQLGLFYVVVTSKIHYNSFGKDNMYYSMMEVSLNKFMISLKSMTCLRPVK